MKKKNGRVLVLGCGGVARVIIQKILQAIAAGDCGFKDVVGASRSLYKYDLLPQKIDHIKVDTDSRQQVIYVIKKYDPDLVLHAALPYSNLVIMDACEVTGVNYLDTACYEPKNEARYRHAEQWLRCWAFEKTGLVGVVGCGFDPGETGVWARKALTEYFSGITRMEIVDCNGGDHHKAFSTNFNPEINIRELENLIRFWGAGKWVNLLPLIDAAAVHRTINFEEVGPREAYVIFHEELESIVAHYGHRISQARFWMTFGPKYIAFMRMFKELGLTSIQERPVYEQTIRPIEFLKTIVPDAALLEKSENRKMLDEIGMLSDKSIPVPWEEDEPWDGKTMLSPLGFLQLVLPKPGEDLNKDYTGSTNISIWFEGVDWDGKPKKYRPLQIKSHEDCIKETGLHGICYTTGVPAMVGAAMIEMGEWSGPGVFNTEQLPNHNLFLQLTEKYGLPLIEQFDEAVPDIW